MSETHKVLARSKSEKLPKNGHKTQNLRVKFQRQQSVKNESFDAIQELLQCGICLDKLSDPRMLPCQHTFCLACLRTQAIAKSLLQKKTTSLNCPLCQTQIQFGAGLQSVENLPKNLYIDSLLRLVAGDVSPTAKSVNDYRCVKCQTVVKGEEKCCQHCMQIFCNICWSQHLTELEANLVTLADQVDESGVRLEHKLDNIETRCEQIKESIRKTTEMKIEELQALQDRTLAEVDAIKNETRVLYRNIRDHLAGLSAQLRDHPAGINKATTFLQLHQKTSDALEQVHRYGEARLIFDPATYRLDQVAEGIYNEPKESAEASGQTHVGNPLENYDNMKLFYKTHRFVPKLIWNKCPRPAGIGVPPWDTNKLYVAATDNRTILILDKNKVKLVGRLTASELLYPNALTFGMDTRELYVTDKWKHCVHVFAASGEYLRSMGCKGSGSGKLRSPDGLYYASEDRLFICDTGNDRIVVWNARTGEQTQTIEDDLNMPMGVVVYDEKIIVADTGNHRIKTFDTKGNRLGEFGAMGRNRGQFCSPEVLAVDPFGFILVGDGGNARIQIFEPDGNLIRAFGDDGMGWVSGIYIHNNTEIIVTDSKKRTLRIF